MNGIERACYPVFSLQGNTFSKIWYSIFMTATEILEVNGDFRKSPLLTVVKKLDSVLSDRKIPYTVIGGLGVVRNGAVRTTVDVDILISEENWTKFRELKGLNADFEVHEDWARDRALKIDVDVIFSGNSWDMLVPYPSPEAVREWDGALSGWFIGLFPLLEIKTAVYVKKREEDGQEIAAKDLSDIVALIQNNRAKIDEASVTSNIHPKVLPELLRIYRAITK
jgi:hypothetical protein